MNLMEKLAGIFFDVFGITKPTPRQRRVAALFVFAMLLVVLCGLALAATVLYRLLHP